MQDGGKSLILLRDSDTGEFYQHPGKWVTNPDDATAFATHDRAIQTRAQIPKAKVELFVTDEQGRPHMGIRLWEGVDFSITEKLDSLRTIR